MTLLSRYKFLQQRENLRSTETSRSCAASFDVKPGADTHRPSEMSISGRDQKDTSPVPSPAFPPASAVRQQRSGRKTDTERERRQRQLRDRSESLWKPSDTASGSKKKEAKIHHVVTDGAEGVGAAHVHGGVVDFVQGANVVSAFHLKQDPAERRTPRPDFC